MPVQTTYPGVYLQELPSSVHTITGTSTSVTAFIGTALRGPTDQAVVVNSFSDFQRIFGGLWSPNPPIPPSFLGYAVNDFFANGGSQAIVVRVYNDPVATSPLGAPLSLAALHQGVAGNNIKFSITAGTNPTTQFNLIITDTSTTPATVETFPDLTVTTAQSTVNTGALASTLVEMVTAPAIVPAATTDDIFLTGGGNGMALSAALATAPAKLGLNLMAKPNSVFVGAAGNNITLSIANSTGTGTPTGKFDLIVSNGTTTENYQGLTLSTINNVINNQSNTVSLISVPTVIPEDTTSPVNLVGGTDPSTVTSIFEAANPGAWGNNLQVSVNYNVSKQVADIYGLTTDELFNLIITDQNTGAVEQYNNLSVLPSPGQVNNVLQNQSQLVYVNPTVQLSAIPPATTFVFKNGNNGSPITDQNILGGSTGQADKQGLYALETVTFNLLCIPPYDFTRNPNGDVDSTVLTDATEYCVKHRAFFVIDAPSAWNSTAQAANPITGVGELINNIGSNNAANAAVFFPRVQYPDILNKNQIKTFPPCGMIAGMMANIDNQRGVWKAPAGLETGLAGVSQLTVPLTDSDSGQLNPIAVNCLRTISAAGTVIWGSRTLQGNDILESQWKYIPVRRLALYIEQSAYLGTQWAVFEPNDASLWRQITLSLSSFMGSLFRQGAFQGQTTKDAFFVKCDNETTTQYDIDNGRVNVLIGFAPLKPAEFVIISIQQIAGQS